MLDPDIVLNTDSSPDGAPAVIRGASAVAKLARAPQGGAVRSVLVNGAGSALITANDQPSAILVFSVLGDRIVRIDAIRDPERVHGAAAGLAESAASSSVTSPRRQGS